MDNKKKKLRWQLPFLLFLIIGSIYIIRNQQQPIPFQKEEGAIFGTFYHVTYQYDSSLKKEIEAELQKVDASLSPFNKASIITKINNNEDVLPDSMFIEVFQLAKEISANTNGAFDITVAPLVNLWGFGFKNSQEVTAEQIDSILQFVGFRMIEIGGEIVVKGLNQKGQKWKVGINKPVDDSLSVNNEIQTILNVSGVGIATSGNYRNFYYKDGKKYAHTIDPHSGYPVQHSILSATVLAKNCATADAYATAFMVLGLDEAKQVLQAHPELQAYLIYADEQGKNQIYTTPALDTLINR